MTPSRFSRHLERVAAVAQDRVAIVQGDTTVSWTAFEDRASRLARYLADNGVGAGSRVAIVSANCPEYLVALFAVFKVGASAANVNYRYRRDEIAYVLNDCRAQAVIFADELAEEVLPAVQQSPSVTVRIALGRNDDGAAAFPQGSLRAIVGTGPRLDATVGARDNEWLLYTGGTTGMPKAVLGLEGERLGVLYEIALSNMGVVGGGVAPEAAARFAAGAAPVYFTPAPLMHGTGLYCALIALVGGGTFVLARSRSFDASEAIDTLVSQRVTDMHVVGDALMLPLVDVLDAAAGAGRHLDLSRLARIQSVGAVWSRRVKERMLVHADVTLIDMIAATEGGPFAVAESSRSHPPTDPAAFRLAPDARLLDPDGGDIVNISGGVGVLAVATTANAGYLGDEAKSAKSFRDIDGVRYAVPGDLAAINPDGTLRLLGRGSSVINTGGEKVYTDEVEAVLRSHPDIAEAVVVGVPDERFGEVVGAVVVTAGQHLDVDELGQFVAERLSGFKKPRVIRDVPEISRLVSAKPDLAWAREILSGQWGEQRAEGGQAAVTNWRIAGRASTSVNHGCGVTARQNE